MIIRSSRASRRTGQDDLRRWALVLGRPAVAHNRAAATCARSRSPECSAPGSIPLQRAGSAYKRPCGCQRDCRHRFVFPLPVYWCRHRSRHGPCCERSDPPNERGRLGLGDRRAHPRLRTFRLMGASSTPPVQRLRRSCCTWHICDAQHCSLTNVSTCPGPGSVKRSFGRQPQSRQRELLRAVNSALPFRSGGFLFGLDGW